MRHADSGFTLLEMMAAVAILGILAALAINYFKKDIRKAKSTEVPYMFGLFAAGEEQRHNEQGAYLSTSASEGTLWPDISSNGNNITDISGGLPATWQALRIQPGSGGLYCQYATIAGPGGDVTGMGARGTAMYAGTTPTKNWFYSVANCDWDNSKDGSYSEYSKRGDMAAMSTANEGK